MCKADAFSQLCGGLFVIIILGFSALGIAKAYEKGASVLWFMWSCTVLLLLATCKAFWRGVCVGVEVSVSVLKFRNKESCHLGHV